MPGWINEGPDLTPVPLPGLLRNPAQVGYNQAALDKCLTRVFGDNNYDVAHDRIYAALAIARYHSLPPQERQAIRYLVHTSEARVDCSDWITRSDNAS